MARGPTSGLRTAKPWPHAGVRTWGSHAGVPEEGWRDPARGLRTAEPWSHAGARTWGSHAGVPEGGWRDPAHALGSADARSLAGAVANLWGRSPARGPWPVIVGRHGSARGLWPVVVRRRGPARGLRPVKGEEGRDPAHALGSADAWSHEGATACRGCVAARWLRNAEAA
jgi:hypothetical protein